MRGDWIILVGLCLFVIIIRVFHSEVYCFYAFNHGDDKWIA